MTLEAHDQRAHRACHEEDKTGLRPDRRCVGGKLRMDRGKRGGAERQVATLEDLARHVIDSCNSCRTEKRGDEVTRNLPVGYERMSERYDIRVEGREDVIQRLCRFARGEVARHPEVGDAVTPDTKTRQAQIKPDSSRDPRASKRSPPPGAASAQTRRPPRAPYVC